jgi:thiamine pyrophosphate-dependent acetolactate synthase large subunit-like protein
MSKKVAEVIVETLPAAGVKHCYGVVGDTLNLIARELDKSEIEWVSMRHEEAGAFAAQAEAQVSGHLTAAARSCGPGSLHFIPLMGRPACALMSGGRDIPCIAMSFKKRHGGRDKSKRLGCA